MKIKLDENLPLRLASLLKDLGHDVHTLHDELLLGHADREIWENQKVTNHSGSTFDSFLEEQGIREEVEAAAHRKGAAR